MLSGILSIVGWVAGASILGGLVWMFFWFKSFSKIEAEITEITSNGTLVYRDKVRYVTDKEGRAGWQFFKTKSPVGGRSRVINAPPTKYVDLLSNGKKYVRLVKTGDDMSIWHPSFEGKIATTEVLSSDDRQAYLYEMQKKATYGKQSWLSVLNNALPFITMIMVVIGGVILYDTVSENMVVQAEINERTIGKTTEVLDRAVSILERVDGGSVDRLNNSSGGVPN